MSNQVSRRGFIKSAGAALAGVLASARADDAQPEAVVSISNDDVIAAYERIIAQMQSEMADMDAAYAELLSSNRDMNRTIDDLYAEILELESELYDRDVTDEFEPADMYYMPRGIVTYPSHADPIPWASAKFDDVVHANEFVTEDADMQICAVCGCTKWTTGSNVAFCKDCGEPWYSGHVDELAISSSPLSLLDLINHVERRHARKEAGDVQA